MTWELPYLSPRAPGETQEAYLARLLQGAGSEHVATATLRWTDKRGSAYGPLEREVRTEARLPLLAVNAEHPRTVLPGQDFEATFAVSNEGTASAQHVVLAVQGAAPLAPHSLEPGQTSVLPVWLTTPVVEPRAADESEAAYASRLREADGKPLAHAFWLEWANTCTTFGPLEGSIAVTRLLPRLTLDMQGPLQAQAGDSITYALQFHNQGFADSTGLILTVTLPDGSTQQVSVSAELARDAALSVPLEFVIPAHQAPGTLVAEAAIVWQDARGNTYGPITASAATEVTRTNAPPVVNAGPDVTITLPAELLLAGTVGDDGLPEPLTHRWVQVSGPDVAAIHDPAQLISGVSFATPGTYVLRLWATDSEYTASDELTVTVLPREGSGTTVGGSDPVPGEESVNVVREGNALRLDDETRPFNFIWVAVSSRGTVVKIDTEHRCGAR